MLYCHRKKRYCDEISLLDTFHELSVQILVISMERVSKSFVERIPIIPQMRYSQVQVYLENNMFIFIFVSFFYIVLLLDTNEDVSEVQALNFNLRGFKKNMAFMVWKVRQFYAEHLGHFKTNEADKRPGVDFRC